MMSAEAEKLENDQARLWALFERNSDDPEVISDIRELLEDIRSTYTDLMEADELGEDSYRFLTFCLRCIELDQDQTYINLEYEIGDVWSNIVNNDNFPALLEENLLTAIEEEKISNVFQVQKMANGFAAKENYPKALSYFQVVKNHINNPSAWDTWARCCAAQNDFAAAIEVLSNGLNNYPGSQILACNRAFYLHKNKKPNEALDALQAFIERFETAKYADDNFYIYAVKLKATIYRELNMPLQALIEYCRLTTAGQCDQDFAKENGASMVPYVEALTYG